jgi:hypothetical protein
MRKARAVQTHRVRHPKRQAAARAYTVEHVAVLGPLMAAVVAPLPEEHGCLVALLPVPEALAVNA